jgi:hypothetical protein
MSLNTPLFWSVVDIDIPRLPNPRELRINDAITEWEQQMQAIYEMAQLWISRSANCPLTVSFTGEMILPYHSGNSSEDFVVSVRQKIRCIVNALCDVSTRWKSLYLSIAIDDDPTSARFFQISPDNIPILQNLSVRAAPTSPHLLMSSQRGSTLTMMMGGDLVKAPSLQRLAFGRVWSSPSLLPVEWSKITEISLGIPGYHPGRSYPLSFLALCPNLTRCSINFPSLLSLFNSFVNAATSRDVQGPTSEGGMCLLPRLRTLQIQGSEPPIRFAENVDLPSLRELQLLCDTEISPETGFGGGGGAFELIRKFGEGLTDVAIVSEGLNESRLTRVLEWLPNVVSLRLVGDSSLAQPLEFSGVILDSVLEKLTLKYIGDVDGGSRNADVGGAGVCAAVLCPKLEKFGCNANRNVGFSEEALVRFIASRRNLGPRNGAGVSHLNSVVVAFPTHRPDKTIRRALEGMGVDLEDMVLITTYKARLPDMSIITHDELDFASCSSDHEDYLSIVAPGRWG